MVRVSYDQKPYRRSLIETWGARSSRARRRTPQSGRAILEEDPDSPGSLGIAISEAVEDAARRDDTAYSLGSVLNHVLLHQTVIGQEAIAQMELAGAFPDVVIGCVGGGSNFAGLAFPFLREKIAGREIDVLACEPAACPTLTRGLFAYDFGDTGKLTPLVADAHARPRLRPGADPRRRPALPRRRAAHLAARPRRPDPRRGLPPERRLRVGGALRGQRGDHPGARVVARDPRRARGGAAGRRGGRASGRSSSTSPATATSTWPRTTTTSPASSSTSRSTRTRSRARCARSRACRRRPRRDASAHGEQIDHEDERLVRLDHAARSARAVRHRRRDRELAAAADLHAEDAGVPAGNHLALAELELERRAAIPRRVELVAGRERDSGRSAP